MKLLVLYLFFYSVTFSSYAEIPIFDKEIIKFHKQENSRFYIEANDTWYKNGLKSLENCNIKLGVCKKRNTRQANKIRDKPVIKKVSMFGNISVTGVALIITSSILATLVAQKVLSK